MNQIKIIRFALFGLIIMVISCKSEKEYNVASIEYFDQFQQLSSREIELAEMIKNLNERRDLKFSSDSLYLPTLSQEKKDSSYKSELKTRVSFLKNRARLFVDYILDDSIVHHRSYSKEGMTGIGCACELANDTLKVNMGIWVFGGFSYKIEIFEDNFNLIYLEDAHEKPSFKYKITDSVFVEQITLNVENAKLVLNNKLNFVVDEQINGYLNFESPKYYYRSDDRATVTKGKIYFTCTIRKSTNSE